LLSTQAQGVSGIYWAGAHTVGGMGLLEQACSSGEAVGARVMRDLGMV